MRTWLGLPFSLLLACDPGVGSVSADYAVPDDLSNLAGETFFDHPYPSDLRVEDGRVVFEGWPNPRNVPLLDQYISYADRRLDGFSIMGSGFLRFDGAIDPTTLPKDGASTDPSSSVQLIDVDPSSPTRGERHPIYVQFRKEAGAYWPANTLAFIPVPGYPLRTGTKYALVVTDAVRDEEGLKIGQAPLLRESLGLDSSSTDGTERAAKLFADAVSAVGEAGISAEQIVHFTAFTTGDPTAEFRKTAARIPALIEAPTATGMKVLEERAAYTEIEGSYGPSPDFQAGETPFFDPADGGGFEVDEEGVAIMQRVFDARFSLSIPRADDCPMPPSGYPIVLFAHGTGGDYRSYVYSGVAEQLGERCMAVMGVDQILHGTRPGAPETDSEVETLFFNFNNVAAARTNGRQSGLDEVQRARLFSETELVIPASLNQDGVEVRFDPSNILYYGHSQGSLNGPLFMSVTADARGGVFSGASGNIQITLLEKTSPTPSVAGVVKSIFLQLASEEYDEVGLMYPPFALAQSLVDPVDPISYVNTIVREPGDLGAKSILVTEGITSDGTGDTFAPPRGCESFANALGLPLQSPFVWRPRDALFGGLEPTAVPAGGLSGNLADGKASGVLSQFVPDGDGHFVAFDVKAAEAQVSDFLANLASDPNGRVPGLDLD